MNVFPDLEYFDGNERCKVDLFEYSGPEKSPLVVLIHGGGWTAGERAQFHSLAIQLCNNGYSVASIGYRLFPEVKGKELCLDVVKGLNFIFESQNKYSFDASKTVTIGSSAGGHLALVLQAFAKKWSEEEGIGDVPEIIGSVGLCPVLDCENLINRNESISECEMEKFSPLNFEPSLFNDVFLIHGNADDIVDCQESIDFNEKLSKGGVNSELFVLEGAAHAFGYNVFSENGKKSLDLIVDYLKKVLPV